MTKHKRFEKWLQERGCEVLPVTSQYEAVRWKGKETGVLYKSGKFSNHYAFKAHEAFKNNSKWDGAPVSTGRNGNYRKQKIKLLERDGCNCFYCDNPLADDITLEHLQSLSSGGKNTLGNMVLAHGECNQKAGTLSVAEKVKIAIKYRLKNA